MKSEILTFVKKVCERHNLQANYLFDGDTWVIHKDGRGVQNFTTDQFYQIPKRARMAMYEPLVRIGINGNLQSNHRSQVIIPKRYGKRIV